MNLGPSIRRARERIGLTVEDAAVAIGEPSALYASYEAGNVTPSVESLVSVSKALRTTVAELLGLPSALHEYPPDVLYLVQAYRALPAPSRAQVIRHILRIEESQKRRTKK